MTDNKVYSDWSDKEIKRRTWLSSDTNEAITWLCRKSIDGEVSNGFVTFIGQGACYSTMFCKNCEQPRCVKLDNLIDELCALRDEMGKPVDNDKQA